MNDKTKNLLIRTASAAVLLAVVLLATLTNVTLYTLFAVAITVGALLEFYAMCRKAGYTPNRVFGVSIAVLIVLVGVVFSTERIAGYDSISLALLMCVVFLTVMVFVAQLWRRDENPIASISTTLAGVIYTAMPVTAMTMLGNAAGEWDGKMILLYLIFVWCNDVFAYLFGITLGRHKMCPSISPKKSWEGFVGGVLSTCVVAVVVSLVWLNGVAAVYMGVLGLVVALSGVAGDLIESMFKRSVGVKDSGNLMPGHGGLLDRFDALFLSAPMAVVTIITLNIIQNMIN